jgi:hypothetical protein
MLEVVEDEEELAVPQSPGEILGECFTTHCADPESLRGGRQDEVGILERRKAHEHDAVTYDTTDGLWHWDETYSFDPPR